MGEGSADRVISWRTGPETARERPPRSFRSRLYRQLEPAVWPGGGLSPLNLAIVVLVLASLILFVLETEPELSSRYGAVLRGLDRLVAILFAAEYAARLWTAGEGCRYRGWRGRLRWMVQPMSIIDLLAFLPTLLLPGINDAFVVRLLRLARLLRIAKLGRYSNSILLLELTIRRCRREMLVTLAIAGCVLLLSATLLWIVESGVQPATFGSIPRALWWSVVTLTTVGYGDVYPVTLLGRILGGMVALLGIGMIAMPAGILSASFVESSRILRRRRHLIRHLRTRHARKQAGLALEPIG